MTGMYDPAALFSILAKMRAAAAGAPDDGMSPDYPSIPDPGDYRGPMPSIADVRAPDDPLRREIPRAPAPIDLAGIDTEETAKLTSERGARVKPNPKGWKGLLLGLGKGFVGLAEGYGRSGARNWQDAIPSMAAGARGRIDQYTTNREDYQPFDEELKQRMDARIRPLQEKYGQDRTAYEDALGRYKIEDAQDQDAQERSDKDRAYGLSKRNLDIQEAYHQDTVDERRDRAKLQADTAREAIKARIAQNLATQRNAATKGRYAAQQKFLEGRARRLDSTENDLLAELKNLQDEKSRDSLVGDTGTLDAINAQYAAVNERLGKIRGERDALDNEFAALAEESTTTEAGGGYGAAPQITPQVKQQVSSIKAAVRSGKMTREEGIAALQALGFQ